MKKQKLQNLIHKVFNNNPEAIIQWAEKEIQEYKKLIKMIKSNEKQRNKE